MSRVLRILLATGLTLGLLGLWCGVETRAQSGRRIIPAAQKTAKKKGRAKSAMPKKEEPATPTEPAKTAAADDPGLKFSRDIAPILVNNCTRCHDGKKKAFDMTSFEMLMKGAKGEKVIVPGNPDESHLVLRIKGEETPKMPQGANNNLSDAAIEKIDQWVKEGARLDAGVDPKAPMAKYAASPEDLRKAELGKLSPAERDQAVEKVGLDRWKKGNSKTTPDVSPSAHFLLFSNLPKDRASATLKVMEQKYTQLKALLSQPGGPPALDWPEKTSLYVYNETNSFVEFARNVESRDVERGVLGTANFGVPQPYVAAVDPLGGKEEPPAPRRTSRSKKSDDGETSSADRSLAGLLTENLAIGVLSHAGKPPQWLTFGVGAFLSSTVDPRSPYTQRLRKTAADQLALGWNAKALEALGGETKPEDVRAIGFAINEWLASNAKAAYPAFVQGMLEGGDKLDQVIQNVLGGNREEFLNYTGQWVAMNYGRVR